MAKTFLYFAYGSNMYAKRICMNSASAVRKGIGYITNYRLDFNTYSKRWKGTSATIIPMDNSVVWGAIWELNDSDMACLDHQEGVSDNIYFAHIVDVNTSDNKVLKCRVYQQCNNPKEYIKPELLSNDRKPSPLYMQVILEGAQESGLPEDYINFLKTIPTNGYSGEYDITLPLNEV